ncbi:PaaX family transcriptional regulator [Planosporangium mesophilum]|uniref:PaaX family transcriptional regulator n=1 Tax=Planosporangium mesophilum TaxID=689768 RepID=A0A8J3TJX0_9ACTN|nr:PaaX family transcriptional regulator C-terminal domain-containing protein [Planosporangium mesophilum]GII25994.1 PaaX family transcriptional regulator [Planosporangium mesophilum]
MTSFDVEEILPDVAVGPVRFPRRQAGGSPQGLAVTLLADYSLRSRAWLPSAAIVALLAESGATDGGARTAISRLARRGVIESSRRGRHTFYRLTGPATTALALGGRGVVGFAAAAESWDGCWSLIAFSMPQEGESERRSLRSRLRWLGYVPLYDGLWVSPRGLSAKVEALGDLSLGTMTVFRAHRLDVDGMASRDPLDAWDLAGIGEHYDAFVRRWSRLLPRVRSGDLTGTEALRARTEVMDEYRTFVVLDPRLPMRLMPAGWLRGRARELFVAVYDGLAEPALRHVLRTVARFVDGPQPDIGAHTVAELLDGLVPAS